MIAAYENGTATIRSASATEAKKLFAFFRSVPINLELGYVGGWRDKRIKTDMLFPIYGHSKRRITLTGTTRADKLALAHINYLQYSSAIARLLNCENSNNETKVVLHVATVCKVCSQEIYDCGRSIWQTCANCCKTCKHKLATERDGQTAIEIEGRNYCELCGSIFTASK